jgi:carboxymethylenebutenolidase
MGRPLSLVAADGFKLGAYRAGPAGKPKGGVVVVQEIFVLGMTLTRRPR